MANSQECNQGLAAEDSVIYLNVLETLKNETIPTIKEYTHFIGP